jgi:DNA-binding CsgD family transcriptional regulator
LENRPEESGAPPEGGAGREAASLLGWRTAAYLLVLGVVCVFLAPVTGLWWVVPVVGVAVPVVLAVLARPGSLGGKKRKEQELLRALAERGELTPATAAMRTSLTVDGATKMLEDLARKGHLDAREQDGAVAYTLRHPPGLPTGPASPGPAVTGGDPRQRLEDPLSERELEVLALLASGKTNSEVARDLYVSVGTVKSHTGNIYRKLDARNRTEALARARELGILS